MPFSKIALHDDFKLSMIDTQIKTIEKRIESQHQLELMRKLVCNKYPFENWDNYYKLAALINEEFDSNVTVDALVASDELSFEIEDKQLQAKHLGIYY